MKLPGFVTPNFITVMRLLLVPVGAYTLFKNGGDDPTWQYISWCVFFILGMSDILDGNLARSRNTITEFGKFLDPIADKVLVMVALLFLMLISPLRVPLWAVMIVIIREFAVTGIRLIAVEHGNVIAASPYGKIKTASTMIALILILLMRSIMRYTSIF